MFLKALISLALPATVFGLFSLNENNTTKSLETQSPSPKMEKVPRSPKAFAKGKIDGVDIEIDYSSPRTYGREIFGALVPFDEMWRTGANDASTITFDEAVVFAGKRVEAGSYAIYSIPRAKKDWTVILNKRHDVCGLARYDRSLDVARVELPAVKLDNMVENMTFSIEESHVSLTWADRRLKMHVKAAKSTQELVSN